MLQCFESVHYQCNVYNGIAIFTLPEVYVLQFKNCTALVYFRPHLGAVYFFTLELQNEGSAKQNGCSGTSGDTSLSAQLDELTSHPGSKKVKTGTALAT